jgi:hypothetical protein
MVKGKVLTIDNASWKGSTMICPGTSFARQASRLGLRIRIRVLVETANPLLFPTKVATRDDIFQKLGAVAVLCGDG